MLKLFNKKPAVPVAQALPVKDLPDLEIKEDQYRELAIKAGFARVETVIMQRQKLLSSVSLMKFLAENGISVYEDKAVRTYMDKITPRHKEWYWRPLTSNANGHQWRFDDTGYVAISASGPYDKPIPEAVLMTMGKIRDEYQNIQFEITDIQDIPKPDPFLRCSVDGNNWLIIERWDEPKFRQ